MPYLSEPNSLNPGNDVRLKSIYESTLSRGPGQTVDYTTDIPKPEFLRYAVQTHGVLLHGSNVKDIQVFEPKLANCTERRFGNMNAIYAVEDEILPIFYAIKDKDRFWGFAISNCFEGGADTPKRYEFAVTADLLLKRPWSEGAVYLLRRDTFFQGKDDQGRPIDEWASSEPVHPLMKLIVTPEEFPFLNDIEPLKEQ